MRHTLCQGQDCRSFFYIHELIRRCLPFRWLADTKKFGKIIMDKTRSCAKTLLVALPILLIMAAKAADATPPADPGAHGATAPLTGTVSPWVTRATLVGHAEDDKRVTFTAYLRWRNEPTLDKLAADRSTPAANKNRMPQSTARPQSAGRVSRRRCSPAFSRWPTSAVSRTTKARSVSSIPAFTPCPWSRKTRSTAAWPMLPGTTT